MFMEINPHLFDACLAEYNIVQEEAGQRQAERDDMWKRLENMRLDTSDDAKPIVDEQPETTSKAPIATEAAVVEEQAQVEQEAAERLAPALPHHQNAQEV